jgi:hypothetical protein
MLFGKGNYSAAENYRNITLRAVMIFYSPIGSRDSKISCANSTVYLKKTK